MRTRSIAVSLFVLTAAACTQDRTLLDAPTPGEQAARLRPSLRYLARGTRVSVGDTIRLLPAPYDPASDGPLFSGSGVTRADLSALPALPRRNLRRAVAAPSGGSTDGNAGIGLHEGRGVYASVSAGRNISIRPEWASFFLLYAPTHLPHGGSCLEISTVHWRDKYPYPNNMIGIWDWCIPNAQNFAAYANLDDWFFRVQYLRNFTDEFGRTREVYMMSVVASNPNGADFSNDTWTLIMYNFSTGVWTSMYSSQGVANDLIEELGGPSPRGWSMWESKGLDLASCPVIPSQTSQNIQVRVGTSWQLPSGDDVFKMFNYNTCQFDLAFPTGTFYSWIALTPVM